MSSASSYLMPPKAVRIKTSVNPAKAAAALALKATSELIRPEVAFSAISGRWWGWPSFWMRRDDGWKRICAKESENDGANSKLMEGRIRQGTL